MWVFVLKNKSDTFEKFKEWHTLIENQMGTKLKGLRTDNGLEFISEQFNEFCRLKGIKRHMTVPRTPQRNGFAKHMNMTLLERVRCMLLGAGLPKSFWGEAVTIVAYLINRCPSTRIDFKTTVAYLTRFSTGVTRFLDKAVVPCVVRLKSWRNFSLAWRNFVCLCVLYKCFYADFEVEFEERENWITNEVTLGLSVFVVRFSWVGKHCKHLG